MKYRRLITDDLGDEVRNQLATRTHQLELLWILTQRQEPTTHGIAGGIIAADYQEPDIADELSSVHVARRVRMRQHRDQIEGRRSLNAHLPQIAEILAHLYHLGNTFGFRMHDRVR